MFDELNAKQQVYGSIRGTLYFLIDQIMKPRWIVRNNELGFRIMGINFMYYKWPDPTPDFDTYRIMNKREFGDVINTINK